MILTNDPSSITRSTVNNLFLENPSPRKSSEDSTAASIAAYSLNYITMGDGSDATFYGAYWANYQDGYVRCVAWQRVEGDRGTVTTN